MVNILKLLHHICLAVVILFVLSESVVAREIRVGIGFALPPYVIRESNSGLEVDLIRKALARAGHEAVFVYLPNLRLPVAFAQGEVDCIAANAAYDITQDSGRKSFGSDTTVTYQNFAITLKRSGLDIQSVGDLMQRRVLGFNNAAKYLGPEFAHMAANNIYYTELADQSLQVRMLYSGRVRVVISDKRIFLWWRHKLMGRPIANELNLAEPLEFHPIFSPAPRRVYFSDSSLRDSFNAALVHMRDSGVVDSLIKRYIGSDSD